MKSRLYGTTQRLLSGMKSVHLVLAGVLLAGMFGLSLYSMKDNSGIVDEIAHIPAGYSYVKYGDYRLNPEHPPLVKDLAGLPLLFMDVDFPNNERPWTTDTNGQWEAGWSFIYHLGNDASAILYWSRMPVLLLTIGFGIWLYWWTKRRWGVAVGLLTLFFYALSPNVLAHSALVTTDAGATATLFMAIVAFAWYATKPSWQRLLGFSLVLAIAQLTKFSAFMLYPYLLMVSVGMVMVWRQPASWLSRLKHYVGGLIAASAASMAWVWLAYVPHTWNMPQDAQDQLIRGSIYDERWQGLVQFMTNINDMSVLKPLVQYLLGVLMVFGRVQGGNVTYFNGQVSNQSFHWYFPQLFVMKTQVALLIFMVMLVGAIAWRVSRTVSARRLMTAFAANFRSHTAEWALGGFAAFYFSVSVAGNLNLGIRHILPVYVPLFLLVAIGMVQWIRRSQGARKVWLAGVLTVGAVWYGASTAIAAPYFIPYFNEIAGGSGNAYKYFSDSSVDWGQDLVRLHQYVEDHPEIDKIAIDYFGGGSPDYYFCDRRYTDSGELIATSAGYDCSKSKFEPWHAQYGEYQGDYIAVSETFLENDRWYAAREGHDGYKYLREREPVAKIGYSIYVYKLR